ncbi:predicted protein [Histoplasma mississippiense (nom. inval.)]|uniref:predicted protein n=1 Tax=Ajellomyces capsulatus (strain NAm1 / WU24) TaxID=2059318 RepID=UPI000157CE70|nr:predicted protein [Histoplasma mississippiense (nom. inval.)]EDN10705.1 predicted protein [Histoplasma mississippiense (nom. inval.)]
MRKKRGKPSQFWLSPDDLSSQRGCDCCFAELAKHSLHARSYSATQEIRLIKCGGSAAGHLSTPEHEPTKTADQMKNNFVAGKNIYSQKHTTLRSFKTPLSSEFIT